MFPKQAGRRRGTWRVRFAFVSVIAVAIALSPGTAAQAAAFHGYSVGRENTGGSGFTGLQVTRTTTAVTGLPNDGCTGHYTGTPVYQTSWLIITADAQNWDEIGIGHQCNDTNRYQFWGYGENGSWFSLGTAATNNGVSHVYKISRSFTGSHYYDFWSIDGVTKASLLSIQRGVRVEAGLESYCQGCHTVYNNTSLKYQKNEGTFVSWAGRDSTSISGGMCGAWLSDTSWRSGEGGC
jgi:hypothetical protein